MVKVIRNNTSRICFRINIFESVDIELKYCLLNMDSWRGQNKNVISIFMSYCSSGDYSLDYEIYFCLDAVVDINLEL